MNKKEITIKRKNERKFKEFEKKGMFDIDTLKQEIYAPDSFKYQNEIFDYVKKVDLIEIEIRYHDEITQHFIQGEIP